MKSKLVQKIFALRQKALGMSTPANTSSRFRHRQVDVWSKAFAQADRNGRIAVALAVLLALALAVIIVQQGRPANVIFVDQLGNAKYFPELASPEPPRDLEAEQFAKVWVRDFLSRDATTAKKDLARALSVTASPLREQLTAQLLNSGELERARDAHVHTAIDVATAKTNRVAADRVEVAIEGQRIFSAIGGDKKTVTEPFGLTLVLAATDRTAVTPNGLLVRYVSGSFGDNHALGGQLGQSSN